MMIDNGSLGLYLADVARAYDALPAEDGSPAVLRCYAALCRELSAQFDVLQAFIPVHFTAEDPYKTSAEMFADITGASARGRWDYSPRLRVFTGGEVIPPGHMFSHRALITGENYNLVFRAVHDGFAHYPGKHSFSALGEYRAFLAHARLLSPDAIRAIATETLGQNAYYNAYGKYAPTKFALLPPALIARAFTLAAEVNR